MPFCCCLVQAKYIPPRLEDDDDSGGGPKQFPTDVYAFDALAPSAAEMVVRAGRGSPGAEGKEDAFFAGVPPAAEEEQAVPALPVVSEADAQAAREIYQQQRQLRAAIAGREKDFSGLTSQVAAQRKKLVAARKVQQDAVADRFVELGLLAHPHPHTHAGPRLCTHAHAHLHQILLSVCLRSDVSLKFRWCACSTGPEHLLLRQTGRRKSRRSPPRRSPAPTQKWPTSARCWPSRPAVVAPMGMACHVEATRKRRRRRRFARLFVSVGRRLGRQLIRANTQTLLSGVLGPA